jgi:membrane protein
MLGAFSVGMFGLGRLGRMLDQHIGRPGLMAVALMQGVATFLYYWWSQHWLLGGRVTWRALLPGAICVGIGTTILFRLTRVIMPGQIAWQVHAYGLIGGVFVLSVWLMILCVVIFGGVLLGALITERRAAKLGADAGNVDESPLTLAGLDSTAADPNPARSLADGDETERLGAGRT